MKTPHYIRQSSSASDYDSDINQKQLTPNNFFFKNNSHISSLNDLSKLNVTGLRQKKLFILVSWLVLLSILSIILLSVSYFNYKFIIFNFNKLIILIKKMLFLA